MERAALGDNIFGMLQYFGRDADYAKEELTFTEEELLEELNSPKVECLEDGTVWVYYQDQ